MTKSDFKKRFRASMNNAAVLNASPLKTLSVMALLLLMTFLGGCGTFVDVAGAQRTIAKLAPYKPPRPAPVIPATVNLAMPEVWEAHNPELPLLCVPIEQGFDLKAWVRAVVKNQSEWSAYADYWESR